MLGSSLAEIPGVGEKTVKALLKHFKTVSSIKSAKEEELAAVKGVTKTAAKNIYNFFNIK